LDQTVWNCGRFGPNRLELRTVLPKPSVTRIRDPFSWTVSNRLEINIFL